MSVLMTPAPRGGCLLFLAVILENPSRLPLHRRVGLFKLQFPEYRVSRVAAPLFVHLFYPPPFLPHASSPGNGVHFVWPSCRLTRCGEHQTSPSGVVLLPSSIACHTWYRQAVMTDGPTRHHLGLCTSNHHPFFFYFY